MKGVSAAGRAARAWRTRSAPGSWSAPSPVPVGSETVNGAVHHGDRRRSVHRLAVDAGEPVRIERERDGVADGKPGGARLHEGVGRAGPEVGEAVVEDVGRERRDRSSTVSPCRASRRVMGGFGLGHLAMPSTVSSIARAVQPAIEDEVDPRSARRDHRGRDRGVGVAAPDAGGHALRPPRAPRATRASRAALRPLSAAAAPRSVASGQQQRRGHQHRAVLSRALHPTRNGGDAVSFATA